MFVKYLIEDIIGTTLSLDFHENPTARLSIFLGNRGTAVRAGFY